MISHTQRFFNPPGLLPPLPFTNPLRGLSHNVEDPIHFDLNRNSLPTDRQLHDTKKLFFNKNNMNLPYMGKNTIMAGGRACYAPYPNMSPLCYKTSPERKDMGTDRSPGLKSGMWPGMEHVGDYCAELLNRDKHYWTEEETGLMLELYEENKDYFNDNKTKKTKLWSVIANVINKRFSTNVNSEQCSQKYRNLKAEFLKISDPTSQDGGAKKYGRHFEQMKRLIDAEEKSVASRNSPTTSSGNNWTGKNGSSTMSKPDTDLSAQMNNNGNNNLNNDNNDSSNSDDLSPTDLRNTHLDIQLTQCPSPMRLEEPHLVNDMQVTSLTLTSPMTSSVSPTLLTTPDDMITTKLSLPSDDDTSRRLDLETSSNEDSDCKFDPSPDGSENQCMMDTTGSVALDQDMRAKNLCLLDNMAQLNQAVHHALGGSNNALISLNNTNNSNNNSNNSNNALKDGSTCMDSAAVSSDVNDDGLKRSNDLVFNMSSSTSASATTTTQDAVEMLKLPLAALAYNPTLPSQQATTQQQLNNAITQSSSNQVAGPTPANATQAKSSEDNVSSYGNELKDIFNDYFRSRNKELEMYQNKEKQNIVCMNKCIDVFRKIMMEKIN